MKVYLVYIYEEYRNKSNDLQINDYLIKIFDSKEKAFSFCMQYGEPTDDAEDEFEVVDNSGLDDLLVGGIIPEYEYSLVITTKEVE